MDPLPLLTVSQWVPCLQYPLTLLTISQWVPCLLDPLALLIVSQWVPVNQWRVLRICRPLLKRKDVRLCQVSTVTENPG